MQEISYTRITLALDIIRKITEGPQAGYHELGILKHQISLGDIISVEPSEEMKVSCTFPGVPEDASNICWQAAELLQQEFGVDKNVHISIEKQIPVQGGLAGGSTNAATVLSLLNKHWKLGLSPEELMPLGRKLGMDVPFYFYGGTAFDSEATSVLRPIEQKRVYHFVLVVPPFGVSTKEAYGNLQYEKCGQRTDLTKKLEESLVLGDLEGIAASMHNDFEISVFQEKPALAEIRDSLLNKGALGAIMSGSGSTMVALVENEAQASKVSSQFEKSFIVSTHL